MHNTGPFTPYGNSLSLISPGTLGGNDWNPMSFDPKLGYLFINTQDLGSIGKIAKNKEGSRTPVHAGESVGTGGPLLGPREGLAMPTAALGNSSLRST